MICIALRKGTSYSFQDNEIMFATWGQYVHAEIVIQNSSQAISFGAWENNDPCFAARDPSQFITLDIDHYDFFEVPIAAKDYPVFLDIVEKIIDAKPAYHVGWECALWEPLVRIFEKDFDPQQHPKTWNRIFCSQVILLILKKCVCLGILKGVVIPDYHSFHFSPNMLFDLCKNFFLTVNKNQLVFAQHSC